MVKLTPEFKEKIKKEMKTHASPERGSSRKLLKTGGRKCVTLRPDWCKQWNLEAGSNVLLFVDENNKLVITPASSLWREEMKKHYSVLERKILEVGNSLAVSVPNDILKEELGWETRKLLRSSDYTTIYEPYDIEREEPAPEQKTTVAKTTETEPEKPESEGMRKSTKIVALSTVGLVIAMGVLIAQNPSPETGSLEVKKWTNGTFNNTAAAGGGIQLEPAFMENSQEGWTLTPDDNRYTSKNWSGWYTQGTGSVAVGSVDETIWLGGNKSVTATRSVDLSGVDTLLIDIHGEKSYPEKYMAQEILIDGNIDFERKNKSFEKMGYEIDVSNTGNAPLKLRIKNTWIGNWPAPTLAADAIRSKEVQNSTGTYQSKWYDKGRSISFDNLTVEAVVENDTSASLTLQVSNDGQSAHNSEEIELMDGTNNYDISGLQGEYARIEIKMETQDTSITPKIFSVKASS